MRILEVELENIKNCESAHYTFANGTNAICGPNGAGKTTIVEAISWALFDHLPGKKADFIRRGAKKGTVRLLVDFGDGNEYTVIRDTQSTFAVYDPRLKLNVSEGSEDSRTWLTRMMGLAPSTDLATMFTSSIGVPQGAFTYDFNQTPARRKQTFDAILKVEEYRSASDKLLDAQNHVRDRLQALQVELAKSGGELEQLPQLQQRQQERNAELVNAQTRYEDLKKRLEGAQSVADGYEAKKLVIQKSEATLREQLQAREFAEKSQKQANARWEEAKSAALQAESLKAKAEVYHQAEKSLQALEQERKQRDALMRKRETQKDALSKIDFGLQQLAEKLQAIQQAKVRFTELAPFIQQQEALQTEISQLQQKQGQLDQLQKRLPSLEKEIQVLQKAGAERETRIKQLMLLEKDVAALKKLDEKQESLRQALAQAQNLQAQVKGKKALLGELETEQKGLVEVLKDYGVTEQLARKVPEIDQKLQALRSELVEARAEYKRLDSYSQTLSQGRCPILEMSCLTVPDASHFEGIRDELLKRGQQLAQEEKKLSSELQKGQKAAQTLAVLEAKQVRKVELEKKLADEKQLLVELEAKVKAGSLDPVQIQKDIELQTQEHRRLSELARQYALLPELEAQAQKDQKALAEKETQLTEDQKLLVLLQNTPGVLADKKKQLAELGDPLGEAATLRKQTDLEPSLRKDHEQKSQEQKKLAADFAELEKSLEAFLGLEEKLQQAQSERDGNREAYQAHLKLLPLVEALPKLEHEAKQAEENLNAAIAQAELTQKSLEEAKKSYDPMAHEAHLAVLDEYRGSTAKLEVQVKVFSEQCQELEAQIQKLQLIQEAMKGKLKEVERWEQRGKFLEFSRQSLKAAGPYITEAYLASISQQANQLYRSITDNPNVDLLWQKDYEIVLVENGHSRPFSSLSGGEQMAAALSVRLALIREISSLDLAFFDEPTTNLDEDRRHNLAAQISRVRDFSQLFVISHDDTFEDATDHVIRVPSDD